MKHVLSDISFTQRAIDGYLKAWRFHKHTPRDDSSLRVKRGLVHCLFKTAHKHFDPVVLRALAPCLFADYPLLETFTQNCAGTACG